ncbi:MAG TPA: PqqD family peptide modification chaperone [Acidobacteriaceae bacterium]|nr:PqqD family peptide modification chaperone [Acidobacteriaceae bacterium]
MSLERSRCYGLGKIGSDIWSRLESPVRVSELVAQLSEEYDAAPGLIEKDVLDLLTQLADEGLLHVE